MTIDQAMALAIAHCNGGRLKEAESICRQILTVAPRHAPALHLLGVIAHQAGRSDLAAELIAKAVQEDPSCADYVCNLGEAYRRVGRLDDAVDACRRAVALAPADSRAQLNLGAALYDRGDFDEAMNACRAAIALKADFAEAHNQLGMVLDERGEFGEAVAAYRVAIRLRPDYAQAHNNLGIALKRLGRLDDAVTAFNKAIELVPDYARAYSNLGSVLRDQGRLDEAIASCRRAAQLEPNSSEAFSNLGQALRDTGQLEQAEAACRSAIRLEPKKPAPYINLGNALREMGRLDEAVDAYRNAIEMDPKTTLAYSNLGVALKEQGLPDEAVRVLRRAIEIDPLCIDAHSNLVFSLYFLPGCDPETIVAEHREWDRRHAQQVADRILPHRNERSSDRRLRIGYVSADLRMHAAGRFLLPLLESHDRERFEIFAYSQAAMEDEFSGRLRAHTDGWRRVVGQSDDQAAEQIREDRIDILVDLSLHSAGNRLGVFARKPAPVQVSYLGYAGTTGLSAMDYRLTDPYLDPPGMNDSYYVERSIRLPETYWCYWPACAEIPVSELPAGEGRGVTFGSLNGFGKMNAQVLELWARLLLEVPKSRLVLHATEGNHRQRVIQVLENAGVDPQRLSFAGRVPTPDYYRQYHNIDIALDPFPYSGGTTNCDALWMGVPMVSLYGRLATARGGLSLLSNLGLGRLAVRSPEDFLKTAITLAGDVPELARLRATLRERMQASVLMDARRFAGRVEQAYRQMWLEWCGAE